MMLKYSPQAFLWLLEPRSSANLRPRFCQPANLPPQKPPRVPLPDDHHHHAGTATTAGGRIKASIDIGKDRAIDFIPAQIGMRHCDCYGCSHIFTFPFHRIRVGFDGYQQIYTALGPVYDQWVSSILHCNASRIIAFPLCVSRFCNGQFGYSLSPLLLPWY